MNNVIRLVTTEGCEGCKIAENIIKKVIEKPDFSNIKLEKIDCLDINYRQFINRYFINDYPTIVFIKDNDVLAKYVGTMSESILIDKIKYWF